MFQVGCLFPGQIQVAELLFTFQDIYIIPGNIIFQLSPVIQVKAYLFSIFQKFSLNFQCGWFLVLSS